MHSLTWDLVASCTGVLSLGVPLTAVLLAQNDQEPVAITIVAGWITVLVLFYVVFLWEGI